MHFAHGVSWDACLPGVVAQPDRYATGDHVITQSCTIRSQWFPLSLSRANYWKRGASYGGMDIWMVKLKHEIFKIIWMINY